MESRDIATRIFVCLPALAAGRLGMSCKAARAALQQADAEIVLAIFHDRVLLKVLGTAPLPAIPEFLQPEQQEHEQQPEQQEEQQQQQPPEQQQQEQQQQEQQEQQPEQGGCEQLGVQLGVQHHQQALFVRVLGLLVKQLHAPNAREEVVPSRLLLAAAESVDAHSLRLQRVDWVCAMARLGAWTSVLGCAYMQHDICMDLLQLAKTLPELLRPTPQQLTTAAVRQARHAMRWCSTRDKHMEVLEVLIDWWQDPAHQLVCSIHVLLDSAWWYKNGSDSDSDSDSGLSTLSA
jgi:hypothetical protein